MANARTVLVTVYTRDHPVLNENVCNLYLCDLRGLDNPFEFSISICYHYLELLPAMILGNSPSISVTAELHIPDVAESSTFL